MREILTVSEVTREYGVSARMLRHYEKIGLISSGRKHDYAYRVFSPEDVSRLRAILVLRKLRLSLKEISKILDDPGSSAAISVFEHNLSQLDGELKALSAVRDAVAEFLKALRQRKAISAGEIILADDRLMRLAETLSPSSTLIREERRKIMEKLEQAEQAKRALADVRIVHLPKSEVAAAHFVGDEPEYQAGLMISDYVRSVRLWEKHPGLRLYGFNHPSPVDETGRHGYEFWITVPDGTQVPPPLEKKRFEGGTYAAHMIQMGNFEEWTQLDEWVKSSDEYEYAGSGDPETMFGALEEHLNYHDHIIETPEGDPETTQLDLLMPVRRKGK